MYQVGAAEAVGGGMIRGRSLSSHSVFERDEDDEDGLRAPDSDVAFPPKANAPCMIRTAAEKGSPRSCKMHWVRAELRVTWGSRRSGSGVNFLKNGRFQRVLGDVPLAGIDHAIGRCGIPVIHKHPTTMISWIVTFLILALLAAVMGFGGLAGSAAGIAQVLFLVFIVMVIASATAGAVRGHFS